MREDDTGQQSATWKKGKEGIGFCIDNTTQEEEETAHPVEEGSFVEIHNTMKGSRVQRPSHCARLKALRGRWCDQFIVGSMSMKGTVLLETDGKN